MSRLKVGPVGRAVQAGVQHAVRMMRAATADLPRMAAKSYFNSDADRPAGIPTLMRNVGAEHRRDLESRLDPARFLRVHRSAIVNLDRIKELQPWFRGDYRVILRDGTELREKALRRIAELERNR